MVAGTYFIVNHCWPCRVGGDPSTVGPAGECYTPTPLRRKSFFPGHYELHHFSPDITKFVKCPRTGPYGVRQYGGNPPLRTSSIWAGHYEVCQMSPDRAVRPGNPCRTAYGYESRMTACSAAMNAGNLSLFMEKSMSA
jgi:hypothetical protein